MGDKVKQISDIVNALYESLDNHFDDWFEEVEGRWINTSRNTTINFIKRMGHNRNKWEGDINGIILSEAQTNALRNKIKASKKIKEIKQEEVKLEHLLQKWEIK